MSFWEIVSLVLFILLLTAGAVIVCAMVWLDRFIREWDRAWSWHR